MKTLLWTAVVLIASSGCTGSREAAEPEAVTTRDAGQMPTVRVQDLLVARVPGIRISQSPDGRLVARARGNASFTGSDALLYVVDGIPVEPNDDGSLPGVHVSEIASIRVLKDPVETAQYGMRGANGVVVVAMKKGARN